jgi:hypothetical protein
VEKQISLYSYWLGLLSVVIALILRGLAAIGVSMPLVGQPGGNAISYNSFLHGAVLFLLLSVASSVLSSAKNGK